VSGNIQLFEDKRIRTAWDEKNEEWLFSIVDVVEVLTGTDNPRRYWSDLKRKIKAEGSQLYDEIVQLKMKSSDGKYYKTDVATTEQLLRIIQSIPSPKAEPFKVWLARIGAERIDETIDPEVTIDRALQTYFKKGYSREWINQRLQAIQVRKELTDEWNDRGIQKGIEYAILTNEISKEQKPDTLEGNRAVARARGEAAGEARQAVEKRTGKPVITSKNAIDFSRLISNMIEDTGANDGEPL